MEPFVALAKRALRAGHEVRLVVPDHSGVDLHGLDVVSLGVDYTALIEQQGVSVVAALRSYRSVIKPLMRAVIIESARAAWDYQPDVLLAHPKILSAPLAADALSIPYVQVEIVPVVTPTRAFPAAGTVNRDLGRFNTLTYRLASGGERMFRRDLKDVSSMIGGSGGEPAPPAATLMPISPALLDRPHDWDSTVHLTGPWRVGGSETVSAEVSEFMAGGDFVYAGFGSMASGDPAARAREVIGGIRGAGARALIAEGLGGLQVPPELRGEDVLVTGSVAHDAVLPNARAAVHHGGIGTVHAATAAGVVSVLVPFIGDQPFWGARLRERGLAPAPVPQRKLTAHRLSRALVETEEFRPAVQAAARAMESEDGPGTALQVLETLR
ncbi:sterol 3beta-glucosyltransferase [Nesterenkonia lutea]|uniref:Sterol 3beta-glucosyltransferase n=1 Tax=Nesterenkonia lutea TaxID=272919 RepID=A0ABR9JC73_9MICC|nr:sterol 3beta-glucosyltransferase [Nesterenkonia lutea]